MEITLNWLIEKGACHWGIDWFVRNKQEGLSYKDIIKNLINQREITWADWLITRLLDLRSNIEYAIFAAESVLPICESKYSQDKRPREAIEAAKLCLL